MKDISKHTRVGANRVVMAALVFGFWPLQIWQSHRTRQPVNIPISLAVGQVRTPEFSVIKDRYIIMLFAKKRLPFGELLCMMGLATGSLGVNKCDQEPLIQANWTVSCDAHVVAQGSSRGATARGFFGNTDVGRSLGDFYGEPGKKCVLDIEFSKDATALAVTDPHLSVEISNESYLAP